MVDNDNNARDLWRHIPGGILGGIGFLSLLSGTIDLPKQTMMIIHSFQSVTRPIWDYGPGALLALCGWHLPNWVKDYLTMGVIFSMAHVREDAVNFSIPRFGKGLRGYLADTVTYLLAWPIYLCGLAYDSYVTRVRVKRLSGVSIEDVRACLPVTPNMNEKDVDGLISSIKDALVQIDENWLIRIASIFGFMFWAAVIITVSYGLCEYAGWCLSPS